MPLKIPVGSRSCFGPFERLCGHHCPHVPRAFLAGSWPYRSFTAKIWSSEAAPTFPAWNG